MTRDLKKKKEEKKQTENVVCHSALACDCGGGKYVLWLDLVCYG